MTALDFEPNTKKPKPLAQSLDCAKPKAKVVTMFPVHYQLSNCSQAGYPTALTILTLLLAKIWFLCFS